MGRPIVLLHPAKADFWVLLKLLTRCRTAAAMGGTHVAAAVALTLIAAAAASSPTGRAAGAAIDVTVDTTTGMYTIDVGGVTWLRSANTSVNVGSKLYSTADKTLQLKSTNSWSTCRAPKLVSARSAKSALLLPSVVFPG